MRCSSILSSPFFQTSSRLQLFLYTLFIIELVWRWIYDKVFLSSDLFTVWTYSTLKFSVGICKKRKKYTKNTHNEECFFQIVLITLQHVYFNPQLCLSGLLPCGRQRGKRDLYWEKSSWKSNICCVFFPKHHLVELKAFRGHVSDPAALFLGSVI